LKEDSMDKNEVNTAFEILFGNLGGFLI